MIYECMIFTWFSICDVYIYTYIYTYTYRYINFRWHSELCLWANKIALRCQVSPRSTSSVLQDLGAFGWAWDIFIGCIWQICREVPTLQNLGYHRRLPCFWRMKMLVPGCSGIFFDHSFCLPFQCGIPPTEHHFLLRSFLNYCSLVN